MVTPTQIHYFMLHIHLTCESIQNHAVMKNVGHCASSHFGGTTWTLLLGGIHNMLCAWPKGNDKTLINSVGMNMLNIIK